MLELLARYADRQELVVEPGFAPKAVRWAIVLGTDGGYLEVLELGDTDAKRNPGRTFRRCPDLSQPELKRGGAGCRHFLVDAAEVVTLLAPGEPDAKLLAKHRYFVGLLRQAAEAMPVLGKVADDLADEETLAKVRGRLADQGAKPTDKVTFAVQGETFDFPVASSAWHDWWRSFRQTLARPESTKRGATAAPAVRCLVSGELVQPAPTHPKVGGLSDVGGLSMGDVLASFKQPAFTSYGFEQAANSPVSEEMAAAYRAGLDDLIRRTGKRFGNVKVVHWYARPVPPDDDLLGFLAADDGASVAQAQQRARELLESIGRGVRPPEHVGDNVYYVLVLSGASGRVMVRAFEEGSFESLVCNIDCWFEQLAIVTRDGAGTKNAHKFYAVLGSFVRDLKDLPSPLVTSMWRSAVAGHRFPDEVLARTLPFVRADVLNDQPARHARLGLLKAFLMRNREDLDMSTGFNPEHPAAAYQCGRLMAVLAALQYGALGNVGAGVVQRYYAAASATPALVFGRLLRGAQFHLHKLDPGLARWHEGRIAEVSSRLGDHVPATLTLAEQSLFALGYYQQIAHDRTKKPREAAAGAETDLEESIHA
jgi:CRISPR-associated protein Csd1